MPRRPRHATGGILYHALNRAVGRMTLFESEGDYAAFVKTLAEVHARLATRVLSYCLMPNHFHIVLWPRDDGELSEFMRLLTVTHTQRWHAAHHTAGTGPLYQGRFKSFPIQRDEHALVVCRYVERNALRARLCRRAHDWPWCSASARLSRQPPAWLLPLENWPVEAPSTRKWTALLNEKQKPEEELAVGASIKRGRPFGGERWIKQTAARLGLSSTLRPRGRPRSA